MPRIPSGHSSLPDVRYERRSPNRRVQAEGGEEDDPDSDQAVDDVGLVFADGGGQEPRANQQNRASRDDGAFKDRGDDVPESGHGSRRGLGADQGSVGSSHDP